jgi:molybdenum transport protein
MVYFTDAEIDRIINEDVPYYDLTSLSVGLRGQLAKISYSSREDIVVCGTEEALKIFHKFDVTPTLTLLSGNQIKKGTTFLEGEGLAGNVHAVWRITENLIEFASGIATRTKKLVNRAKEASPGVSVVTSRKSIPFTKKLTVKAIHAGGGHLHRLGLSETILIFDNHIRFLGGIDDLIKSLPEIRQSASDRSITVEVKNRKDALRIAEATVDVIQLDKFPPQELRELVKDIRKRAPNIKLIAAGAINLDNIAEYALTGVDIILSSWPYYGKPIDLSITIEPIPDIKAAATTLNAR